MPKRKIEFVQGGYYHIYNRGAGRQSIFREDENYRYLLGLIKKVMAECQVTLIAYCLLPNHYHWLVRQDGETPASHLAQRVFGSYTQAFNRMYDPPVPSSKGHMKRSGSTVMNTYAISAVISTLTLCAMRLPSAPIYGPIQIIWSGSDNGRVRWWIEIL